MKRRRRKISSSLAFVAGLYGFNATAANNEAQQTRTQQEQSQETSQGNMSAQSTGTRGQSADQGKQDIEKRRAKLREVSGKIIKIKEVKAKGTGQANQVVMLQTKKNNRRLIVDLGPVDQLKDLKLKIEGEISAQGPVVNAGDRIVMIAHQVKANGQSIQIDRQAQQQAYQQAQKKSQQGTATKGTAEEADQTKTSKSKASSKDSSSSMEPTGTSGQAHPSGQTDASKKESDKKQPSAPSSSQQASTGTSGMSEKSTDFGIFLIPVDVDVSASTVDTIITEDDEIKENPEKFIGKTIVLRGNVEEVLGPNAFRVDYDGLIGASQILVIGTPNVMTQPPKEDARVQLKGVVHQFDKQTLETDFNIQVGEELENAINRAQPMIVATDIY